MVAAVDELGLSRGDSSASAFDINELQAIIAKVRDIPAAVGRSDNCIIHSRMLDFRLFEVLQSQPCIRGDDTTWQSRLQLRSSNLRPYIGKHLACVVIKLPGICYTVEIDLHEKRAVHWEWMAL